MFRYKEFSAWLDCDGPGMGNCVLVLQDAMIANMALGRRFWACQSVNGLYVNHSTVAGC